MASDNGKWYKKVFGEHLIKCSELTNGNSKGGDENLVATDEIFDNFSKIQDDESTPVIGLYFSPLGVADETINCLIELYRLKSGGNDEHKKNNANDPGMTESKSLLEVIHVFLTSGLNWMDRCSADENAALDQLKHLPWYAVSVKDRERAIRLTRRYQIKSLTPSLILVNGRTGKIITKHGRERLLEDPMARNFPWKPRPLSVVLQNVALHPGGKNPNREVTNFHNLKGFIIGFYFSAHWCPPCKGFTPHLVETYRSIREAGANFEIIFVSSDRSAESQETYSQMMPWLTIAYPEEKCKRELASLFGVQGIPTLVIVDADGSVITTDGRGEINDDPSGQLFPWRPRLVNVLTERQSAKLQDTPAVVLFVEGDDAEMEFAETVLSPAVKELSERYQNDEIPLEFFIAIDNDTSDTLREFIGIDDAVPLLALINIPDGSWSALEDGEVISEDTVKEFVAKFLKNELPVELICSDQRNVGNT